MSKICNDVLSALEAYTGQYEQVCYVIDQNVAKNHPASMQESCLVLTVGEEEKTIETVQQIWDFLFAQGMTRRGLVVAIGGGVLTDIAGFAAATYKRGIDYINVPTTLLAMVDASSGGKTGFNYHGLKNSIGAFYSPVETLIWPGWLNSLPAEQFLSGFAEMLKTGLVKGQRDDVQGTKDKVQRTNGMALWEALLRYDLERMPIEELTPLIEACVAEKEEIVAADPKEEGLRKVLNFGHTFGHAIEELAMHNAQLRIIPHGYAVLYGMIAELYLSVTLLGCPQAPLQQLTQLMLHYYGKPQCKCSDVEPIIALMRQDKKNERAEEINCTLLYEVGKPAINQTISEAQAKEALEYLFSL